VRVGVTGGIGAGKSLVAQLFGKMGAYVIEADEVGRRAVTDPSVLRNLVEAFGEDILEGQGVLDRRVLGRLAFHNAETRETLNKIVWPRLGELLEEESCEALDSDPERTVVIDAALLLEWGDPKAFCDMLIVVTAPEAIRIRRIVERMGLTEAEVRDRMASQLSDQAKIEAADYVIVNDAELADLDARALDVWAKIH
jgi:dephospho-CoA kinase